jgi:hypothetical protein
VDGPAVVPRGPDFPELSHQINKFAIRGVELQSERVMYINPQKQVISAKADLRKVAGWWLKARREARGLSQRELAELVGVEYFAFVSQLA